MDFQSVDSTLDSPIEIHHHPEIWLGPRTALSHTTSKAGRTSRHSVEPGTDGRKSIVRFDSTQVFWLGDDLVAHHVTLSILSQFIDHVFVLLGQLLNFFFRRVPIIFADHFVLLGLFDRLIAIAANVAD